MERVEAGMSVVGTSGRRIGVVSDVAPGALRIKLTASTDIWIEATAVFTVEDDRVTLICEEDGLHRYRVNGG